MQPGDPADIRNWQRRPDGITTSGKLEPHDPARLAAIGVRHVVNLALDDHPEALCDEAALMAAVWNPLDSDDPRAGPWRALLEAGANP